MIMEKDAVKIDFMTFDIVTGELLQKMRATDIFGVELQCSETVDYVLGHYDRGTHKVVNGNVVPIDAPQI